MRCDLESSTHVVCSVNPCRVQFMAGLQGRAGSQGVLPAGALGGPEHRIAAESVPRASRASRKPCHSGRPRSPRELGFKGYSSRTPKGEKQTIVFVGGKGTD